MALVPLGQDAAALAWEAHLPSAARLSVDQGPQRPPRSREGTSMGRRGTVGVWLWLLSAPGRLPRVRLETQG